MKKLTPPKFAFGEDILEVEDAALKSLKEDEDVYKVIHDDLELSTNEVKIHLGALLDLQEDMKTCKRCPGLDACPKDYPCYRLKLGFVEGQLQRFYEPCEKKLKHDRTRSMFFIRHFPEEWLDQDMRSIDVSDSRRTLMIQLKKILSGKSSRWLYVTGKHKMGKTFILAMMAKEFAVKNSPVGFASTAKLIENMKDKAINDKAKFERNMQLLFDCPLLVLDEFGNEFKSDFVFSNILYPLLSNRAKNNLSTWFTSDFSISEIVSMYKPKIGEARAKQFARLLEEESESEIKLEGVAVY